MKKNLYERAIPKQGTGWWVQTKRKPPGTAVFDTKMVNIGARSQKGNYIANYLATLPLSQSFASLVMQARDWMCSRMSKLDH